MQKFVLSLGLLLGVFSYARAQTGYLLVPINLERREVHYGAFGSFHTSHYTANSSADYTFTDNGSTGGTGGGVFMDMFFTPHVAFTIGLNTASRGGQFTAVYKGRTPISSAIGSVQASYDLKTRYTYLPLGLKFFTSEVLPRTRFYVQGQLAAGFLTSATNYGRETKSRVRVYSTGPSTSEYKYSKQLDFIDFEASLGLGTEIRLANKLDAFASVRYSKGLNSAQNTPLDFVAAGDFYAKSDAYPLHNTALNVEVGLIYIPYRRVNKKPASPATESSPVRSAYQQALAAPVLAAQ